MIILKRWGWPDAYQLSLIDLDLKISLLVDCLYKNTVVGSELWHQYPDQSTPTLKRGVPNQFLAKLHKLGVDIKKLPGCDSFSVNMLGFITACPRKEELNGKMPPTIIPMLLTASPLAKPDEKSKEKEERNDRNFPL